MHLGVQRRSIYLAPLPRESLDWLCGQFEDPAIYPALGLPGPAGGEIRRRYLAGDHHCAEIRAVAGRARLGFVVVFPPWAGFPLHSFAYAIVHREHRNGFHALHAADAMAHYLFDHLGVPAVGWETREGRSAAQAVVRRLGYQPGESREIGGERYRFYALDRATWAARRARLEAAEPAGRAAFVILAPPFEPAAAG